VQVLLRLAVGRDPFLHHSRTEALTDLKTFETNAACQVRSRQSSGMRLQNQAGNE
jgi:hypothetical protein